MVQDRYKHPYPRDTIQAGTSRGDVGVAVPRRVAVLLVVG